MSTNPSRGGRALGQIRALSFESNRSNVRFDVSTARSRLSAFRPGLRSAILAHARPAQKPGRRKGAGAKASGPPLRLRGGALGGWAAAQFGLQDRRRIVSGPIRRDVEHRRAQAVGTDLDAGFSERAVLQNRVPYSVGAQRVRPSCPVWLDRLRHQGIVSPSQRVNAPVGPSRPSRATRTASRAPSSTVSVPV